MHVFILVFSCLCLSPPVHRKLQLNPNLTVNVQNYAQVWIDVSLSVCCRAAGSQRMKLSTTTTTTTSPTLCLSLFPLHHPRLHLFHPATLACPPPPAHHHQTPAAGSLPHLTPSSTYWACVITGAQHHPWPPHLPPSLVGLSHLGPYDGGISRVGEWGWGGVLLLPKTAQSKGAVKSEKKIKTSVIGVKSCRR